VSGGQVHLEAGAHTVRLTAVDGGSGVCDLDYFELTLP
jgi:hypothetical protein